MRNIDDKGYALSFLLFNVKKCNIVETPLKSVPALGY